MERLLFISSGADDKCTSCAPVDPWMTLHTAAEVTGRTAASLLNLAARGELHTRHGPDGIPLICAVSLSLNILKGEKDNETNIP